MKDEILFTPTALLELLLVIEQLSDAEIGVYEDPEGNVIVSINGVTYLMDCSNAVEVEVDPEVVETVSEVNETAYEDLTNDDNYVVNLDPLQTNPDTPVDEVEGGILKELATTLLVGGAVRLGGAAVKNFMNS